MSVPVGEGEGAGAGATLLLAGGRVPGGDGAAVDIEVADGVVRDIRPAGSPSADDAGRRSAQGAAIERLELDGRWVVPGLWDEHVHFSQWASVSRRLDVSAARSAIDAATLVAEALRSMPPSSMPRSSELLVGYGFRDALWPDAPTSTMLDSVTGSRPVVLVSGDLHCCWLNSAALAQFGLAGHPDGVLREEDAFAVHRALDDVPASTIDEWALDAARAAAARGVVGIVDLEMAWNHEVWGRRLAAGHDLLRVEFGVYPQHLQRALAEGLRTGMPVGEGGLVQVGPFKVITDGSLNTRTAYCFDEYPGLEGQANSRGLLTVAPEELRALLETAVAAGFVPAVHAIGDHANRLTLDAYEHLAAAATAAAARTAAAAGFGGATGRRRGPTLEHAQLLAESDFARFARLGVTASVQPEHAMDDRDVADHLWAGRTGRSFALASLLLAGADLAMGSDAPVAPLDPWVTMAAAVGRTRDAREPWHPEQRISPEAALAASARGRAHIRTGDVADLAVTDLDPLAAAPETLRTMPVALTLLAGRPTHRTL